MEDEQQWGKIWHLIFGQDQKSVVETAWFAYLYFQPQNEVVIKCENDKVADDEGKELMGRLLATMDIGEPGSDLAKTSLSETPPVATPISNLDRARQLRREADAIYAKRSYSEAATIYGEVLVQFEQELGPVHDEVALTLNSLGNVSASLKLYSTAEQHYKRALSISHENVGPNQGLSLTVQSNIGFLYLGQRRFIDAEVAFKNVVGRYQKRLPRNNSHLATSLENVAHVLVQQARHADALPYLRDALRIRAAIRDSKTEPVAQYNKNAEAVALCANKVGLAYGRLKNFAKALDFFHWAANEYTRLHSADHPEAVLNTENTAFIYKEMGRYEEAEHLYTQVLTSREASLGAGHEKTLATVEAVLSLYRQQKDFQKTEELMLRVITLRKQMLGPSHLLTAGLLNQLHRHYNHFGYYDKAVTTYRLLCESRGGSPNEPSNAAFYDREMLAWNYVQQGAYEQGEKLFLELLSEYEKLGTGTNEAVVRVLYQIAKLYKRCGRLQEAEDAYIRLLVIRTKNIQSRSYVAPPKALVELLQGQERYANPYSLNIRLLEIYEQHLGPEHSLTCQGLTALAESYKRDKLYSPAADYFDRVLAIHEKYLGREHAKCVQLLMELKTIYEYLGNHEMLVLTYKRLLCIREKTLPVDHPDLIQTINRLAASCAKTNQASEAIRLYERLLLLCETTFGPDHAKAIAARNNLERLRKRTFSDAVAPINLQTHDPTSGSCETCCG